MWNAISISSAIHCRGRGGIPFTGHRGKLIPASAAMPDPRKLALNFFLARVEEQVFSPCSLPCRPRKEKGREKEKGRSRRAERGKGQTSFRRCARALTSRTLHLAAARRSTFYRSIVYALGAVARAIRTRYARSATKQLKRASSYCPRIARESQTRVPN